MENSKCKIIYEDENVLVIDKPAGISVYSENKEEKGLIENLIKEYSCLQNAGQPPRYGIVHRLDKETSGILLVAKNNQSLAWLQKQFKENLVQKKYVALVSGIIQENQGKIETLIGRSKKDFRKQKVYLSGEPEAGGKRMAITRYKALQKFSAVAKSYGGPVEAFGEGGENYTLIEAEPETGRKHQIRCHLAYLSHPIAGDKLYGFKNQPCPEGLKRQFLHASYLKIKLPGGQEKEFKSELSEELNKVLERIPNS